MKKLIRFILFDLVILIISFTFFLRMTKPVDVQWSSDDFKSGMSKVKVNTYDINKLNIIDSFNGNIVCNGQNQISTNLSNAEVSAILATANNNVGPIKDIRVKFLGNNKFEANFTLNQKMIDILKESSAKNQIIQDYGFILDILDGTPVYIKGKLNSFISRTFSSYIYNSVDVYIDTFYIGNIQISEDQLSNIRKNVNPIVNTIISKYIGLYIQDLRLDSDKLIFKGALPAKIDGK